MKHRRQTPEVDKIPQNVTKIKQYDLKVKIENIDSV